MGIDAAQDPRQTQLQRRCTLVATQLKRKAGKSAVAICHHTGGTSQRRAAVCFVLATEGGSRSRSIYLAMRSERNGLRFHTAPLRGPYLSVILIADYLFSYLNELFQTNRQR